MKFIVKNLGLIKEAEISPAKITVICGPNNTSKTWLAYAIYGYLKAAQTTFFRDERPFLRYDLILEDGIDCTNCDAHGGTFDLNEYEPLLRQLIGLWNKTQIKDILPRIFRVSKEFFENTDIKLDLNSFSFDFSLPYERIARVGTDIYENGSPYIDIELTRKSNSSILTLKITPHKCDMVNTEYFPEILPRFVLDACIDAMIPNSFIITSERAGISIFQKELDINKTEIIENRLFNVSLNNSNFAKIADETLSRYALPVKDNIGIIRDYTQRSFNESEFAKEAEEKLAEILGGTFAAVGNNDIAFMIRPVGDRRRKIKLPIHFSSSMSKSLLLLDTYVRHIAEQGDILIIDEPELNLHPKNQRKVARFLAWLANRGVKVIITTHSDYIIREFNILGVMHNLPLKQQTSMLKEFKYAKDELLNLKDDVKIYIVSEKGEVSEAPYAEHGFDVKTFDDTINEMNHIYDTLLYAREGQSIVEP